jgi:hypothetical protein
LHACFGLAVRERKNPTEARNTELFCRSLQKQGSENRRLEADLRSPV